jgi:cytochrome P450
LRYEGAVQSNFRTLVADADFHGVKMKKGASVLVSWAAANHDPDEYPNPKAFDIDRASLRSHLGFGGGIHTCPGAALARQELAESYDLLLQRLDNFRLQDGLSPGAIRRMGGLVTHGLSRLPLQFERRANEPTGVH